MILLGVNLDQDDSLNAGEAPLLRNDETAQLSERKLARAASSARSLRPPLRTERTLSRRRDRLDHNSSPHNGLHSNNLPVTTTFH